jgi:hypothetical protein
MQMQECVPRCPRCPGSGPPAATTGEAISCTTIPWPPRLLVWRERGRCPQAGAPRWSCRWPLGPWYRSPGEGHVGSLAPRVQLHFSKTILRFLRRAPCIRVTWLLYDQRDGDRGAAVTFFMARTSSRFVRGNENGAFRSWRDITSSDPPSISGYRSIAIIMWQQFPSLFATPPETSPGRSDDDMLQGKAWAYFVNVVVWLRSLGLGKYEAA